MRWQRLLPSAAIVILTVQSAFAQTVPLRGKVTLKQADGAVVPVAGAAVDVYRTDIRAILHATTDATGAYELAGVPMMGTYTIVVSAKGAQPAFTAGVRAGRSPDNDFTLTPGDGSRPTLEQITAFQQTSRDGEAENREATRVNDLVRESLRVGKEAYEAGRFDEAVGKFREALAALPDEPTLLTNLSEALRQRGADRWNAALKSKNTSEREPAKQDWIEAAEAARQALGVLGTEPDTSPGRRQSRLRAASAYALGMGLVARWVGSSVEQSDTAWRAYQQLMALTADSARKSVLLNQALEMVFNAGNVDLTITESRKVLAANPNHLIAHYVLGGALFATGDKKNYQESADRLQWYLDHAPANAEQRANAKDALDYIITSERIRPKPRKPTL